MSISKETVHKLAHLARLELTEEQEERYQKDLGEILDWVEKLEEVNTDNVEPLTNGNEEQVPLREDVADNYFKSTDEALKNAPEKDGDYYIVPKVLG